MLKAMSSHLEWRSNKNQQLVAFENQMPLCHFENPQEEARQWVASNASQIKNDPKIVVIGVGSGYHLDELAKTYPYSQIVAIDCRIQITSFLSRKMKNIEFISFTDLAELAKSPRLQDLMNGKSVKLTFQPAYGFQKKMLDEIHYFLNIRTQEALAAYLNREITGPNNVLMNMRHLFENAKVTDLPYRMSEVLTIQEIIK